MVEVAAAVIQRADGSFLLAQRPPGKVYAGWWEFPGGKVEAGEPAELALARELHEELGIGVLRAYPWITRRHAYEHASVVLRFFRVSAWTGEPHPRESQSIRWQRLDELMAEPMLPANAPVLASLGLPSEYAITNAGEIGIEKMLSLIENRLRQGLRLLQVREPLLDDEQRNSFTLNAIGLAHRYGCKVLVKSMFPGADGLHVTASQLMKLEKKPAGLAAASCHTRAELDRAMQLELDFAILGPVKDKTPALGWKKFSDLARGASIPVYAIGGLVRGDLEEAWAAGAHGVAMIRGAWG
jgi:8-oxo-dGTP diphosphatase